MLNEIKLKEVSFFEFLAFELNNTSRQLQLVRKLGTLMREVIELKVFSNFKVKADKPRVNFINILHTNFLSECHFGSFFYLHFGFGEKFV